MSDGRGTWSLPQGMNPMYKSPETETEIERNWNPMAEASKPLYPILPA